MKIQSAKSLKKRSLPIFDRLNAPARASLFYTLGSILSRGAAFLITPIITRLLTPADFGSYSLFNAALSALTVFGTLDICGSVFWRAMQKFENERHQLLRSALILISICSAGAFMLFALAARNFENLKLFPYALPLLLLSLLSNGAVNLYSSACKFSCRYSFPVASSFILGVIAPALACATAIFSSKHSGNALFIKVGITTLVGIATAIPIYFYVMSGRAAKKFAKEQAPISNAGTFAHIKYLLKLALPMLPYYISLSVMAQADKLIISSRLGESALGAYSVANSAGSALTAVAAGICASLTPWIMRKARQQSYFKIRQVLYRAVTVFLPLALVFLCFAPELFAFLAPKDYISGLSSVYPIALGGAPQLLAGLINAASLTYERPSLIILSGAVPAVISLGLNMLIIDRLGIITAGAVSFISHILMLLISSAVFKRLSGKSLINANKTLHILLFSLFYALTLYAFKESIGARIFFSIVALFASAIACLKAKKLLAESSAPS